MKLWLQVLLVGLPVMALAERPINELPMFGGEREPTVAQNIVFSKDPARGGWTAYYSGDPDKAMRRFNQAWMFDRNNSEVYWGFGLIMQRRAESENPKENLAEAIKLLSQACDLSPKDGRILGDLAFAHTLNGVYLRSISQESCGYFKRAGKLFEVAYALSPDYPPIIAHWSMYYFYIGEIRAARDKAAMAEQAGYQFDSAYLEDLRVK
jgi:tetratricopeptide (TPR) repeat protein